jgi:hypothetical protein
MCGQMLIPHPVSLNRMSSHNFFLSSKGLQKKKNEQCGYYPK